MWEGKCWEKYLAQWKNMAYEGSAPFKSEWIFIEKQTLSQKLETGDCNGYDLWQEWQKKELRRKYLRISQTEKAPLEN
jgi:hypothetical protein